MASSNGIIFCVTGPLWEETIGHLRIPLTKASDHRMETFSALLALCERNPWVTYGFPSPRPVTAELWCFLWSAPEHTVDLSKQSRSRSPERPLNLITHSHSVLIEIFTFSFKIIHLKMSSGKWWLFCFSLNVLRFDLCPIFTVLYAVLYISPSKTRPNCNIETYNKWLYILSWWLS